MNFIICTIMALAFLNGISCLCSMDGYYEPVCTSGYYNVCLKDEEGKTRTPQTTLQASPTTITRHDGESHVQFALRNSNSAWSAAEPFCDYSSVQRIYILSEMDQHGSERCGVVSEVKPVKVASSDITRIHYCSNASGSFAVVRGHERSNNAKRAKHGKHISKHCHDPSNDNSTIAIEHAFGLKCLATSICNDPDAYFDGRANGQLIQSKSTMIEKPVANPTENSDVEELRKANIDQQLAAAQWKQHDNTNHRIFGGGPILAPFGAAVSEEAVSSSSSFEVLVSGFSIALVSLVCVAGLLVGIPEVPVNANGFLNNYGAFTGPMVCLISIAAVVAFWMLISTIVWYVSTS